MSFNSVAAYSFIPTYNHETSTTLPKFSKKNSEGQDETSWGMDAMHCLPPSIYTLDAVTDYDSTVTYHGEFMRFWKAYIAEHLRRVLYYSQNKPASLSEWVCPKLEGDLSIDLQSEASRIQGVNLPFHASVIPHEVMPFNELTSKGTAQVLLQMVKNIEADVLENMEKVTKEGDDGLTHIVAGDHATIEGTCPMFFTCLMVDVFWSLTS